MFGVPLDVCAQSMYHAIKAVADGVSNLSLREIHLVNIDSETTQFIQSVFLQLTSSDEDGSVTSENLPPKPSSVDSEPEGPPADGDQSLPSVGGKDEDLEEACVLQSENAETTGLETSPSGKNTSDEEVTEEQEHLLVAAEDPQTHCDEEDEPVVDREQMEGHETVVEQYQHSWSGVPDNVEHSDDVLAQEQKSHEDGQSHEDEQLVMDEDDKKLANEEWVTEKVTSSDDDDNHNQSVDVKISEDEEKSLANSQPLTDQEDMESADFEEPHNEVSSTTEKDSQTLEKSSGIKDSDTGETAGYEEHHHASSEPDSQLETFMQDLSLEEYHEDVSPSDLPENTSRAPKNSTS